MAGPLMDDLLSVSVEERLSLVDDLTDDEANALLYDWEFWARPKQLPPDWAWYIWLIKSGRGFGKTRTGAEWIRSCVNQGFRHIGLIGQTVADVRDVMIQGESGILAICPPWDMPEYVPSNRLLLWKNGAQAKTFSGDKPGQLRGPQHEKVWGDEIAKFQYPEETLDNMEFGLRLGADPQALLTSTPRNLKVLKKLIKDPAVHVTDGSMYENQHNLAPRFVERIRNKYENTRLGRQEIYGQLLDDNPDALWSVGMIEDGRVLKAPQLQRVVVAIDPSGNRGKQANTDTAAEAGIITAGSAGFKPDTRDMYVLKDSSGMMTPIEWAKQAIADYNTFEADAIVAEENFGGEMVRAVIKSIDSTVPVRLVRASRGKAVRAEPIATVYEQGRGHHVGLFPELEDELTQWDPNSDMSPNRLDALVWAGTDLLLRPATDEPRKKKPKRVIGL
jgi:phage terminase large subunit-like protein